MAGAGSEPTEGQGHGGAGVRGDEAAAAPTLRDLLRPAHYVPETKKVPALLHEFQRERVQSAIVVDEYGELLGLITLEDIIEELIGKFTTSTPDAGDRVVWNEDGNVLVDGSANLRELNRKLELELPTDGPKTLNGLILEHLQDIPETGVSMKIADTPIEVVQTQDRMVRTARVFRPISRTNEQ